MSTSQQESKKLETKILTILKKHISKNDTVVTGISGGPDSTFLLQMLSKIPCKIIVAHINHQLRKESDSEQNFVKKIAKSLSKNFTTIRFFSKKANIASLSQKLKQGIEETARQIRYGFFKELAKKHQAKYVITAHHADDNLETIILNFTRGASLQGLIGMRETEISKTPATSLFRPLLAISKKQILNYLKFHKLPFKTDKSNKDTIYKRNFIRHKIIPLLTQLNPNIIQTIAQNSQNLREIDELTKSLTKNWLTRNLAKTAKSKSWNHQPCFQFSTKSFCAQPAALQKAIILYIYRKITGSTQNLKAINLTETLQLMNSNIGNKQKKLGKLNIIKKDKNIYIIIPFGKTKTH